MAQTTSALWKTLFRQRGTRREYQFDIAGTVYGPEVEVTHSVDNGLYEKFGIGNAATAKLTLSLFAESIPRAACIKRYIRLRNGDQASEWLPKGVFYANRRSEEDGLWTIEAFDAMRKAEQPWAPDQSMEFPMPMPEAVKIFARIMGVEIDPRTQLNPDYTIDYPTSDPDSESGDFYSIRQELQWIAAAHCGNWIITDAGKLLLVPLLTGTTQHDIGLDLTSLKNNGIQPPISRVTLLLDDRNSVTAGNDTGTELLADCPHASQAMVNAILVQAKGCQYQMFNAADVALDPAAELGDGIAAGTLSGVIAQISDDGTGFPSVSAPGEAELEDEYPIEGPITKEFNRRIAATRSVIEKSSEEVRLAVETVNQETAKLAEFSITVDGIRNRVEEAEKGVSTLSQTVSGFDATVKNLQSGLSQTLRIAADGVTITNASGSKLIIDGGQLKANSITAEKIDVASLAVSKVYDSTGKKVAIDCSSTATMYIGGNDSASAYSQLLIKGSMITFNVWGDSSKGISIHNITSYYMRPDTSNLYSLGDSSHLWAGLYATKATIKVKRRRHGIKRSRHYSG